ncbi:MAG: DUF4915 domain-containing protein [Gammaproteobacteria bacterium]
MSKIIPVGLRWRRAVLSMPHSPRWYQGKLWFLESGQGRLPPCLAWRRSANPAAFQGRVGRLSCVRVEMRSTAGGHRHLQRRQRVGHWDQLRDVEATSISMNWPGTRREGFG